MKTTYLTRTVRFSAAHRYYRPEWTPEKNAEIFGACANPHGHGHNYVLEVTFAGIPDTETGFCVDLGQLDRLLADVVVTQLDHQHLNHTVEEFTDGKLVPTTENLVIWIWERLEERLGGLVQLRLIEDSGLWVDYFGEEAGEV